MKSFAVVAAVLLGAVNGLPAPVPVSPVNIGVTWLFVGCLD